MEDGDSVDPWDAAFAAQEERAAGAFPRPMLTRGEAMAKADAYFREEGRPDVAVTALPNPLQGLWIVGHQHPSQPDELVIGTAPLVVPSNGPVYMAYGPVPPWPEELGLEEPECWRYDRGEDLLGEGWDERLCGELEEPYWYELLEFLADERGRYDVFPPPSQTFKAFELTPYDEVKVVILGQDPYPNPGRHTDWRSRCPRRSSGRPLAEEHPQGPRGRPFQDLGPARDRARAREPGRVGGPRRSAIEHRSDGARWLQEGPRASIHSDANRRDQTSCSATSTG